MCSWEFANNHEWDGTDDGSYWTSIETDNIRATSASPVPKAALMEEAEQEKVENEGSPQTEFS